MSKEKKGQVWSGLDSGYFDLSKEEDGFDPREMITVIDEEGGYRLFWPATPVETIYHHSLVSCFGSFKVYSPDNEVVREGEAFQSFS